MRAALEGIEGIVEVRQIEGDYYVIRSTADDARDDAIIRAFLSLDCEDFHFVAERMRGTLPDGLRVL